MYSFRITYDTIPFQGSNKPSPKKKDRIVSNTVSEKGDDILLVSLLNDERVYAFKADDKTAEYVCPECKKPVVLRKGKIRIAHFSHKAKDHCRYGEGVSEEHLRAQKDLYDIFTSNGIYCELEYCFGNKRRADVYVEYQDKKIVFEIQHSNITFQTILERNLFYADKGCSVIWMLTSSYFAKFAGLYKCSDIRLPAWQQDLLRIYGVLYVWNNNSLYASDFDNAIRNSGFDPKTGEMVYVGNYYLISTFVKNGIAAIDIMWGLNNKTLTPFTVDYGKYNLKLFGLSPWSLFPADWKEPRKDLTWDDPLQ